MNRGWVILFGMLLVWAAVKTQADYVLVPASSFQRGSVTNGFSPEGFTDEEPALSVWLPDFYLEDSEVSYARWTSIRQWALTNGYADLASGSLTPGDQPVTGITWYDALKWCNARSDYFGRQPVYFTDVLQQHPYRTGEVDRALLTVVWTNNGFRLPTESEWEKAARGGLTNAFYPWGGTNGSCFDQINDGLANTASTGTVACGSYVPNAYGLYNMAGNVSEWCWDVYTGAPATLSGEELRCGPRTDAWGLCVTRGGSWYESALDARCAARGMARPETASSFLGLRCALSSMNTPITEPTPVPTFTPMPTAAPTPIPTPTPPPTPVPSDTDGDGISDIACYYPIDGGWFFYGSRTGFYSTHFGYEGTLPVSGDFDGDGQCDFGCYYPPSGDWYISRSRDGFFNTRFGFSGTVPVTGDFDGDVIDDIGCYFAPEGLWFFYNSGAGFASTHFGFSGTVPVIGDFDGDGHCDFGCYYAANGSWFIFKSRDGFWSTQFGYTGTVPVTGDFDGDGLCDFGCYHADSGAWYFYQSRAGFRSTHFGYKGTVPVTGDYDGDGFCDFGCYYAPGGNWYLFTSSLGFQGRTFGFSGTIPVKTGKVP